MTKKIVMVDCLSQFRIRYVVEVENNIDDALDEVIMREHDIEFVEFSQEHLGTMPISHREISSAEYLAIFNQDNDYLKSWPEDKKFGFINKINYTNNDIVKPDEESGC